MNRNAKYTVSPTMIECLWNKEYFFYYYLGKDFFKLYFIIFRIALSSTC